MAIVSFRVCRGICFLFLSFLLLSCAPRQAQAQFVGFVGLQNTREVALNAVTTAGVSANLRNIGQSAHQVLYVVTSDDAAGPVTDVRVVIEASSDGTDFFAISDTGTNVSNGAVTARGYYSLIRINLVAFSIPGGTTATLTAVYTGTQTTGGERAGNEAEGTSFIRTITTSGDPVGTPNIFIIPIRNGRSGGMINFRWSRTCTTSVVPNISIVAITSIETRAGSIITQQPINCGVGAGTTFAVPDIAGVIELSIRYNLNGATLGGAGTYSLFFLYAGSSPAQSLHSPFAFPAHTAVGTLTGASFSGFSFNMHTVSLNITGSPTTCTFEFEGSLDSGDGNGGTWFDLSGPQTCTSNVMFHVVNRPVRWVRPNLTVLTGGTSPTVTMRYLGVK